MNSGQLERWLAITTGAVLASWGFKRRDTIGGAAVIGAAALLYHGTTGQSRLYEALGMKRDRGHGTGTIADRYSNTRRQLGGAKGIHVEESVTINKPVAEVFRFWRNFENLASFMKHLDSVTVRDEGVSHWVATGPAGTRVEWDARIINEIDNKLIGWQSLEGSSVATAGSVHFDETEHGTRVRVRLQYNPPAGRFGAAIARLFGEEPSQTIREDLRRLKRLLETGEIPTTEGQPSGRRTMAVHRPSKAQSRRVEMRAARAGGWR